MTNYFLMSLAVADLLVCMVVMPFGAIVFLKGHFHLETDLVFEYIYIYRFSANVDILVYNFWAVET